MSRPRLFVSRPLPIDAAARVGPDLEVDVFEEDRDLAPGELLARAKEADGLVSMLGHRIDGAFLDACPRLRVVANYAVGYDNIDVAAAIERGVWVTNTPNALTEATADVAFALILAVARRVREGHALVESGGFHGWAPTMLLGLELSGATLGLFGFGRIGKAVARRARGFGMRVLVTSRSPVPEALARELGVVPVDKATLLAESDVLSLHCPLTPETRHAIGADELARMRPHAILVNTARGPVVDEAALVAALDAGRIGGAGLDVYEEEPRVHPGLLGRPNVVLLPHLGSATVETRRRMAEMALDDARAVLLGREPRNVVGRPAAPKR